MPLIEIIAKLLYFAFLRVVLCYCVVMFVLKLFWLQKELWSLIKGFSYNVLAYIATHVLASSL